MKIYTSNEKIDEFIVHLTCQEMKNIKEKLIAPGPGYTSPWSIGSIAQIEQALKDNMEYRLKKWE